MAGHAIRWQGTGSDVVYRSQKSKNPDNLHLVWRRGKITGIHLNRIANNSAMRGVYYMPGKVQDFFLCSLLLCIVMQDGVANHETHSVIAGGIESIFTLIPASILTRFAAFSRKGSF